MEVTLLYFDDCPNWREADAHLRRLAAELPAITVLRRRVETAEEATRLGYPGSPTVLIDGVDPFDADASSAPGLACRVYATPSGLAGSPTLEQLRAALERVGGEA